MGRVKDYFTAQARPAPARAARTCASLHSPCATSTLPSLRTRQGLGVGDIPLALVYHELISVAFAAAMWTARARRCNIPALASE